MIAVDILMIVPPAFHSSISNHLAENYSSATHSRARIDLKRYTDGEKDDDEDQSESTGRGAKDFANVKEGTARLLRRFRSHIKVSFGGGLHERSVETSVEGQC